MKKAGETTAGNAPLPLPSRVVVASSYGSVQRRRLNMLFEPAEIEFLAPSDRPGLRRALPGAEIAVVEGARDAARLDAARLRWVHVNQSGLDACASPELIASNLLVTSASGRSAPVLAEHALFFMLSLAYNSHALYRAQHRRAWGLGNAATLRGLVGRRVLVVGLGHTARALVLRCLALGMQVRAFRRRDLGDEGLGIPIFSLAAGDRIDDLLPEADVLVLAASLNDDSHGMIGERQFQLLKRGAMLVNVARAQLVVAAAMKAALRDGRLASAGLDVAAPEPLPPWDSLWGRDNVLLTPHVTPRVVDREQAEVDIIEDNYRRYLAGEPLRNLLRAEDRYTRGTDALPRPVLRRALRLWSRLLRPTAHRR